MRSSDWGPDKMGRLLGVSRLVIGDIKRHPVQSALLLVMVVTMTTTLALGLALRTTSQSPFALTRAATRGPDVIAELQPNPGSAAHATRPFATLLHAPVVVARSGPYPIAYVHLTDPGIDVLAQAEGRDPTPAAIDQPLVTAGHWVRPGGAVIERSLASTLSLHIGDTIHLGGRPFPVTGIAITAATDVNPMATQGLVWLLRADAEGLATRRQPLGYVLNLKLANRADTTALGMTSVGPNTYGNSPAAAAFVKATANEASMLESWQQIRHGDYHVVTTNRHVLLVWSWLLALLAIASIAVVVGGRMAEQTRRVGLLKAVGATPQLVAIVLLAENLLIALAAAAIGLAAGEQLSPLLTNPGDGLLGTPGPTRVTATSAAIVIITAAAVAAAATIPPAIRGARTSTMRALNDPARPPSRLPEAIAFSVRLPVPLLLGVRLAARRPRRTALTAASMAIAVAMIVAVITLQASIASSKQQTTSTVGMWNGDTPAGPLIHIVSVMSAILLILAAINTMFTTWATVIDAERPMALARALGATPREITASLTTAQLIAGFAAALVGIPAGFFLYALAGGDSTGAGPSPLWLLAVIPGTLLAVAIVTAVPAWIGAHRGIVQILQSE